MATLHLDTHVLLWVIQGSKRLGAKQQRLIERHDCLISPMVALELEMLHEIGRIRRNGRAIVEQLQQEMGLAYDTATFEQVAVCARDFGFTRDPFDRLICAQADVAGRKLLTADTTLLAHFPNAIWA